MKKSLNEKFKIYSYDIETYKGIKYLSCISNIVTDNLQSVTKNQILNAKSQFFRHESEDNDFFKALIKNNKYTVVFIHNLKFEYEFIKNLQFINHCTLSMIGDSDSSIKSLICKYGKNTLKFIDTWLITNKSIKIIGDENNFPKLEYNYDIERYWYTDLEKHDYDYNRYDTIIAFLGFFNKIKQYPNVEKLTDIKPTATSFLKNYLFSNPNEISAMTNNTRLENNNGMIFFDKVLGARKGGLNVVNPITQFNYINNVHSFDLTSAHPHQIIERYFPKSIVGYTGTGNPQLKWDTYYKNQLNEAIKKYTKDPINLALDKFIFKRSCIIGCSLINLKCKHLGNKNMLPTIPNVGLTMKQLVDYLTIHKYNYNLETMINKTTLNSKIYTADKITGVFTLEDLLIYKLTYDFEITDINYMSEYEMSENEPILIQAVEQTCKIKNFYKDTIKKVKKAIKEGIDIETVIDRKGLYPDTAQIKNITLDILKYDYNNRCKPDLNGIFGITYQQNVYRDFIFNYSDKKFIIDDITYEINHQKYINNLSSVNKIYFNTLTGVYVALYTRLSITGYALDAIKHGNTIHAILTDSLKMSGDYTPPFISDRIGLGGLEYEKTYNLFTVIGNMKYLGLVDKDLQIKCSGIPKEFFSQYTIGVDDYESFKEFVDKFFRHEYIVQNGKKYANKSRNGENIIINGKKCHYVTNIEDIDASILKITDNNKLEDILRSELKKLYN